ncbi:MAG TPA: bifunctional SulP family inorganic anion transporter/carbonic anhydrase [Pseudonocardiaceae bacterium]|nr:bifunctional SulP family inorganic anion transporter/carbonic anhydrase [Pseudonocardiaceae bacterium]
MTTSDTSPTPAGTAAGDSPPATFAGRLLTIARHDLPASIVVFLIAIPLSLGIAVASGAPLMSGLIAAVIGGVVAGALGGSPLSVSGPAAGLTVVVAGLVVKFGWPATAAITVAAGALQLLLGFTKAGRFALSLSPGIVHGMMAGIGVTIAVQQAHVALGGSALSSVWSNLRDLPAVLMAHHTGPILIAEICIVVLVGWPKIPKASVIPAPLLAVALATAIAALTHLNVTRVRLPRNPLAFTLPQLPHGSVASIGGAVLTMALATSVASLLAVVAVDKLHTGPRANLDRELLGQGAANIISGALGGLPIASVIIRSEANVTSGARTRASAILHGLWIALFVLVLGGVLEMIPVAALSAMLVVTGVRLVNVGHIRQLWRHRELTIYAITVLGVVFLGLVEGVLLGVAVALLRTLWRLTHSSVTVEREQDHWQVTARGSLVFLGVGRLTRELRRIPAGTRVVIELHIDFMDFAVFEAIHDWRTAHERLGGEVVIEEIHDTWYYRALSGRPEVRRTLPSPERGLAPWSQWQNGQSQQAAGKDSAPEDAIPSQLIRGMHEFERRSAPLLRPLLTDLAAHGQQPTQLFITCADSRVVPSLLTTSGPGDQFCVRNVGNLVPPYAHPTADASVGAAVEFAVDTLEVSSIVICGHSDCGAVQTVLDESAPHGSYLRAWLRHAESGTGPAGKHVAADVAGLPTVERASVLNVLRQLDNLTTFPTVRHALSTGRLSLIGMYFDISAARVYLVDPNRGTLASVREPGNIPEQIG